MTWKKRIISIVLCLCALLCAASVRAEAEDAATTHTDHPICGANHTDVGNHTSDTCSSQTWTAWDGTTTINNDFFGSLTEKYLYLSQDVTPGDYIIVPKGKTLYLCLNGHSLKSKAYYAIYVSGTLVLCDCNGSEQGKGVISHGEEDGSICGADGIYVVDNAIFTMYGGTISNNDGRGVLVSGGTFTMYGGEISHNTCITKSAAGGGGVWVKDDDSNIGNFTMYGGTICKNTYKGIGNCGGGGVYASGTGDFIIQGGEITNNQCSYNATNTSNGASGGGLYISGKPRELKIENCTISNNTCDGEGGGIFIISNETGSITNCTISNNSATGASSKGGGLAFDTATVTITGGSITDNKTAGKGGAMAVGSWGEDSKITLSSGLEFSGNAQGCTADKNGKLIGGTANDVYLNSSAYLRLADDFSKTSTAAIVVTTASEPNANGYKKIAEGSASVAKTTDFTYGTDSNSAIGIIAKTNNGKVELLACKHNYSQKTDSDNHWQECSVCGDKKDVTAHQYNQEKAETGCLKTAATCTAKAVYYKSCVCGARGTDTFEFGEKLAHTYDKEVATETYLKSAATCTDRAVYYKSCVCARAGTETFEDGETNPNNHTGQLGDWQTNTDEHWKVYSCCQAQSDKAAHTWDEGKVTTSPTCTTAGEKTFTCTACSATKKETIPATGHAWDTEWSKDNDHHWHECNNANCDAVKDKAEHSWDDGEVTTSPTCTTAGEKTFTCTACSATKKETIPATGHAWDTEWSKDNDHHWHECNNANCDAVKDKAEHSWDDGEVTTSPTCTTAGEKTFTCTACSATKKETIPATGHAWDTEWSKDHDHHWHKCKNCNAIDESTKAPHSWDEGTVTTPATCTAAGVKTYTCTACSATKTEPVPATGHTPGAAVRENIVAATCTTAGSYDEVVYCMACRNEVSRTQKTIDKLAHDYDTTKWVKADENQHGHKCKNCDAITDLTAHVPGAAATETTPQLCAECGYVIAPATHPVHTWVFVAETPATCNAAGEREHYKCTCGRTSFKNGDDYYINEDATVLTIEKNSANHTGAPDSKWHSDSTNHWQEYTCCHARANEAAHSGGAATCTAQAVCQVCGKAYGPLAAHAWQPATCTAPKTCSVCHTTEGTALGHDWGAWKVTTPATKDAPGVETRTCAHNSAHTETRSIPKLSTAVYTVSEDTKIAQIEAKVDGLDKILELNENKALVNDGKSVGVSLTVKNTASSGVSEKIKEKLAGSNLVGLRLELTVEKTVTANGVVESKQTIPDTVEPLKTTITLPAELQGKSGYVVYRLHDGNVHVLTETANENGEFISVSADKTQITICARLYSEYVIAYQTGGSSGGGYHPVNPTPVKATSANTGDAGVLLYGVTAALSLTGTAWLGAKSRKH